MVFFWSTRRYIVWQSKLYSSVHYRRDWKSLMLCILYNQLGDTSCDNPNCILLYTIEETGRVWCCALVGLDATFWNFCQDCYFMHSTCNLSSPLFYKYIESLKIMITSVVVVCFRFWVHLTLRGYFRKYPKFKAATGRAATAHTSTCAIRDLMWKCIVSNSNDRK